MEKADPVILAVTTGCRVELLHQPGYAPRGAVPARAVDFCTRYEYRDGRLTEVGPATVALKQKRRPSQMTLFQITVYHNEQSRFMPYEDGHRLTTAVSHWLSLPASTDPQNIADWVWHVFNADLDHLQAARTRPDGELAFLAACVYRLLRLRSLSVGDVIAVSTGTADTCWLACDTFGWKHISEPSNIAGAPLAAEKVYQHLHDQRRPR